MLEIKNLNVRFKDHHVLNNLNLNIEEGIVLGILGKNGAGKTTLFESLYQSIKYNGSINWHNEALKREHISYLETENYFYPYITGKEYLSYFSESNVFKYQELSDRFGLPLDKYAQDYSSGMKKNWHLWACCS